MRAECTVLIGAIFIVYNKRSLVVKFSHFSCIIELPRLCKLELVSLEKFWEYKTGTTLFSWRPGKLCLTQYQYNRSIQILIKEQKQQ